MQLPSATPARSVGEKDSPRPWLSTGASVSMVRLEGALETHNLAVLNETLAIAESLRSLPMEVNLWQAQNIWNDLLRRGDSRYWSREWREGFRRLGKSLNISVSELVTEVAGAF